MWLVRHGETEWSRDGRHTSVTDLPLTDEGEAVAGRVGERLAGEEFALVLTSPRLRARRTAELIGHADATVDDDLVEWAYGDYEGITNAEIRKTVPDWTIWTHPAARRRERRTRWRSGWTGRSAGCAPENVVLVQPMHLHDGTRRIRSASPELFLHLIDQWAEAEHVGDEYDDADRIAQRGTFRLGNQLHVEEGLLDAGLVALHQRVGLGVDATHAGDKYEVAGARGQVPGTGRFDCPFRRQCLHACW